MSAYTCNNCRGKCTTYPYCPNCDESPKELRAKIKMLEEQLKIAISGWKNCFRAYGEEVMHESTEETNKLFEQDYLYLRLKALEDK